MDLFAIPLPSPFPLCTVTAIVVPVNWLVIFSLFHVKTRIFVTKYGHLIVIPRQMELHPRSLFRHFPPPTSIWRMWFRQVSGYQPDNDGPLRSDDDPLRDHFSNGRKLLEVQNLHLLRNCRWRYVVKWHVAPLLLLCGGARSMSLLPRNIISMVRQQNPSIRTFMRQVYLHFFFWLI